MSEGNPNCDYILVAGETGAGKSTFINRVSGSSFETDDDIDSCTKNIQFSESFSPIEGRKVKLIDTPGLNDRQRQNSDLMKDLREISSSVKDRIIGAIYLHSLQDPRASGTTLECIKAFWKVSQELNVQNVVILTTKSDLYSVDKAQSLHQGLCGHEQAFKNYIAAGAHDLSYRPGKPLEAIKAILEGRGKINVEKRLVEPQREDKTVITKPLAELLSFSRSLGSPPNAKTAGAGSLPKSDTIEYILVMGMGGSGKTTFINDISGSNLGVSDDIGGCTKSVQLSNPFKVDNRTIVLIDTPGFDDIWKSDASVLSEIAVWLGKFFINKGHLIGVIYVHSIDHIKFGGSTARNLKMFRESIGERAANRIVIATTHWDNVVNVPKAERRLEQLKERSDFFEELIDGGAQVMKCRPDMRVDVVREVLKHNDRIDLQIQKEMVFDKKIVRRTGAGQVIENHLKQSYSEWDQSFKEAINRAAASESIDGGRKRFGLFRI